MSDLPQPKVPNILITGTPGVGKSSLAKAISEATPLTHIDVGKIVKVEGLVEGKDEKFDTLIPDQDRLLDHLDHDGGRQDPFRRWSPGDFITPGPQSNFHPLKRLYQPKVPNILITGTPGVGKSSLAKAISEATLLTHIDVGKIVKEEGFVEGKDEKFDTLIPDEDRLLDHLDHDGGRQDPFRRWSPGDFITPGPQSNFHPLSDSTKF
ncbi:Adenylate kinase isoenzyme 6-like protein [Diplonema papillatum]|nr:Adenylate kinase isoenzyme 6-like protein [Diplonema papillatum]KAJ9443619.1 Adenylate kinase isoenzyme 6-like protein [Diplonema papillatum]